MKRRTKELIWSTSLVVSYIFIAICLLASSYARAGVFNSKLYRYAPEDSVIMITYYDKVAHCAALTLSFRPEQFGDKVYVGSRNSALHMLEKSNLDQVPHYKAIVDAYDLVPNSKKTQFEIEGIHVLRMFLSLPKKEIAYTTMVSTLDDVNREISDHVSASFSDGTFKAQETAAAYLYQQESCEFSLGKYNNITLKELKKIVANGGLMGDDKSRDTERG